MTISDCLLDILLQFADGVDLITLADVDLRLSSLTMSWWSSSCASPETMIAPIGPASTPLIQMGNPGRQSCSIFERWTYHHHDKHNLGNSIPDLRAYRPSQRSCHISYHPISPPKTYSLPTRRLDLENRFTVLNFP